MTVKNHRPFPRINLESPIEINGKTASVVCCRFYDLLDRSFSVVFFDENNEIVAFSTVVKFNEFGMERPLRNSVKRILDRCLESDFWGEKEAPISQRDKDACRAAFYEMIDKAYRG